MDRHTRRGACWAMVLSMGIFSTLFAQPGGSGRNERGQSPGPSGRVLGEHDFRVPLTWLAEPGQYGPGEYARQLAFQGRKRYYEFHVPPSYRPGTALPVVLVLHGGGGNAAVARYQSGMNPLADEAGFIAVYPAATSAHFTDRLLYWNAGTVFKDARQRSVDDVGYIAAVLDDLAQFVTIDPKRVYATGISNGSHMCYLLAARLQDRIAAIGPVAGQRKVGQYAPMPPGPVSVIHFHGRLDTWAPFNGGRSPASSAFQPFEVSPAPEAVATWAAFDGCQPTPQVTTRGKAHRHDFGAGRDGSEVVLWILDDGGHTWPGGKVTRIEERQGVGPINRDISASREMWEFFQRHPKP